MRSLVIALAATVAAVATGGVQADDVLLHAMSFNVRTSYASTDTDSCSVWDGVRKTNLVSNIQSVAPDFLGTQETSDVQKAYLDAQLGSSYGVIGETTGSLNGAADEIDALYYRSDTWTLLTNGQFWLGTDPDTMSYGWGMSYYRTCVWGRFQHKTTGQTVCMMNTHWETPGNDEAQENGAQIILDKIGTVCDSTDSLVVLTGDLNALPSYPAISLMFENNMAEPVSDPTFCGDMLSASCTVKYDYTFHRIIDSTVSYVKSEVSRVSYDGCYPSDHAALIGTFCLSGSCSNSSSSSGSVDLDSSSSDTTTASIGQEEDVLGTVKSATDDTTASKDSSSSGSSQTVSTQSEGGSSASTTVGIVLGLLGAVAAIAVVVVQRKKMLEARTLEDKDGSQLHPAPSFFTRAHDSESDQLSPLRSSSGSSVSESPIPTLAAAESRDSRSSSVSVTKSEKARLEQRQSSRDSRASSAALSIASSRRSSSAVIMGPSDFSESNYSVSNYSESYSLSMAESQIHFSEMFAPESCTSDDDAMTKSKADFAML